jgi:DeoR family transcriptional regulator, aga operon transcriptional repressor
MANEASQTKNSRVQKILQELLREGKVSVERLAKRLKVSPSTIRRELAELEHEGLLRRTHGGAVRVEPMLYEPFRHVSSFGAQEQLHTAEKRRIGLAAAEIVQDGDIIAIGAGTTTTQVARSIRHRKGITVLTNAINIAMELSHRADLKVIVTGGTLSGEWFALTGPVAIAAVGEMFVDKVFIGVDGIHPEHGLTTNYPEQAAVHRAMMRQARQRIVVADHTKIGDIGTALIGPASDIDLIITDKGISPKKAAQFAAKKIEMRKV